MDTPDTNDILMALYIQTSRVYDAIMLLLDDETRDRLDELHTKGGLLGSDPSLEYEDTAESDNT